MSTRRFSFFWVFRDNLITRGYITAFLLSSIAVVACTILLLTLGVPLRMPLWLRIPYTCLGMLAAIGACEIWFGMWSYWERFDASGVWTKRLWFLVLLFGFWFGSILYFFAVYIPQVLPRMRSQT